MTDTIGPPGGVMDTKREAYVLQTYLGMDKPTLTEQKIADLLGYLEEGIKQGAELTKEQAPLVAQEIIKWGIAERVIYIVGLAVPLGILSAVLIRASKKMRAKQEYSDWPPVLVFGWVSGLIAVALTVINSLVIAKAVFAPRLFLIQFIREMLK